MTTAFWLAFANFFLLTFAVTLVWLNLRLAWRQMKLNALLAHNVVQAWEMRHLPIWVPWCVAHRMVFRIDVVELPPRRRPRENWGR